MASAVLFSALVSLLGVVLGVHWGILAFAVCGLLLGGALATERSFNFLRSEVRSFLAVLRANGSAPCRAGKG